VSRNGKSQVYKIRYKRPGGEFGTRFSFSKASGRKMKGRILSVRKVSSEELFRVGEYNNLPTTLMREFRKSRYRDTDGVQER